MSDEKPGRIRRMAPVLQAGLEPAAPEPGPTRDTAAPAPAQPEVPVLAPSEPRRPGEEYLAAYRATLTSIGDSQTAVASDVAAMALEVSGLARANLTAAGDGFVAFFTARSLVDAVEAQLTLAR